MSADWQGPKARAWLVAGGDWFWDDAAEEPEVIAAWGMCPVLILPGRWRACPECRTRVERTFGWAMAELYERRHGWLGLIRHVQLVAKRVALAALVAAPALIAVFLN